METTEHPWAEVGVAVLSQPLLPKGGQCPEHSDPCWHLFRLETSVCSSCPAPTLRPASVLGLPHWGDFHVFSSLVPTVETQ